MTKIKIVKPKVWNFEVIKGEDAWKEVVYSARMSGVPESVKDEEAFWFMVENDYGSALEHIIIKFDIKVTKAITALALLEHRIASHSGFSTRYKKADQGISGEFKNVYEVILPRHYIKNKKLQKLVLKANEAAIEAYEELISEGVDKEIARYALPFSQAVGVYHITINLRSLLNLLSLRLCIRSHPEFRCVAAQIYFNLIKKLPIIKGLVGCRGFMKGLCPENEARKNTNCHFKNPESEIFIPTMKELEKGVNVKKFNKEKAIKAQETIFKKWAEWN